MDDYRAASEDETPPPDKPPNEPETTAESDGPLVELEPAPPAARAPIPQGGWGTLGLVAILAILLVVVALFCAKFYLDQQETMKLAGEYARMFPTSLPKGSPEADRAAQQVNAVRTAIAQGDISRAQRALSDLSPEMVRELPPPEHGPDFLPLGPGRRPGEGGRGLPLPPNTPPDVAEFLREHRALGKRFSRAFAIGAQLDAQGEDTARLKELLREFMHAAEQGDAERAEQVLGRAEEELGDAALPPRLPAEGLPDEEWRGEVDQMLDRFRALYERKEAAGADLREPAELFRQARALFEQGEFEEARGVFGKAYEALKRATPGKRRRGPPRRPPSGARGPGPAFLQWVVQSLLQSMKLEDRALAAVREDIANTRGALREHNQDQVTELLTGVLAKLGWIEKRRNALAQELQEREERARRAAGRPRPERRRGPRPGDLPPPGLGPAEAREALLEAFGAIRAADEDVWETQADELVRAVLEQLYGPMAADAAERVDILVPPVGKLPDQEVTERAVVAAFQSLTPLYIQLVEAERDRADIEPLIGAARTALYAQDYPEAYAKLREAAAAMVDVGGDLLDDLLRRRMFPGPPERPDMPPGSPPDEEAPGDRQADE